MDNKTLKIIYDPLSQQTGYEFIHTAPDNDGEKLRLKRNALLSLQFWKERGTLKFMITTRDGDLSDNRPLAVGENYRSFGLSLANTEQLTADEKEHFRCFCLGFLDELEKKK